MRTKISEEKENKRRGEKEKERIMKEKILHTNPLKDQKIRLKEGRKKERE